MFQLWVELTFCQPVFTEAAKPECNPRCESDAHYSTNTTTPARQNQAHSCVNHVAMEDAQAAPDVCYSI
jgi:hypothetical protein